MPFDELTQMVKDMNAYDRYFQKLHQQEHNF